MPFGALPLYSTNFSTNGGGAVPIVSAVSYSIVDTAGDGQRIRVTVNDSTGCTAIAIKTGPYTVPFGDFGIEDATHVSGIPPAWPGAFYVCDVIVTNASGDSTTGTGLIQYWTPAQITSIDSYLDSNKGITDAGGGAVSQWDDQSVNARIFSQLTGANQPIQTASVFGTLPAVRFVPNQFVQLDAVTVQPTARSVFAVAKWTSTVNVSASQPGTNPPLTIVGDSTGNIYCANGISAGGRYYTREWA